MSGNMLEGKVAVVTGAGRGIGRATAICLAANGAKVVVCDVGAAVTGEGHDVGPAQQVVAEIAQANGQGRAVANTDSVAEWENAQNIVQTAIDNFGRIDMVVNNAGILRDRMFHYMSPEEWDAVIKVHLYGAFYVSRAAVPHFRKQESGCFVHITSHLGADRQRRADQLRRGEAGHRRAVALHRDGHAALQYPLELHRPACVQPHDRDGAGPKRGAVEGARREDAAGSHRAIDRVPRHRRGEGRVRADLRRARQRGVSLQPAAADPDHGAHRRLDAGKARRALAACGEEQLYPAGADARRVSVGSGLKEGAAYSPCC